MSWALRVSTTSTIWAGDRPKVERSPPESVQWPPALTASLARTRCWGRTPSTLARSSSTSSSPAFSSTKKTLSQAAGLEAQVDEFRVLVAVADDAGLGVAHQGDGGDEFGLGTHFQPVMVVRPELGDFFHYLLLLVDLDGEHPPVLAGIIQGFDGFAE